MEDPESENNLFSEPMKTRTPSPLRASSNNPIKSFLRSISSNSVRTRCKSLCASMSSKGSRRPARSDLVPRRSEPAIGRADSVASPSATICAVSVSSWARWSSISLRIRFAPRPGCALKLGRKINWPPRSRPKAAGPAACRSAGSPRSRPRPPGWPGPCRADGDELDMFQRHFLLGGQQKARAA